jgi:uncharacterized protein
MYDPNEGDSRFYIHPDHPVVYDANGHNLLRFEDAADRAGLASILSRQLADIPDTPAPDLRQRNRVSNLKLSLSGSCNLDCRYCFRTKAIPEIRDPGIARRAMTQMVEDFGHDAPAYSISYNLSSEPFLHHAILSELLEFGDELSARCGKPLSWYVLTNGTFFGGENDRVIRELIRRTGRLAVSIDGPPEIQNMNRRYPGGGDTYDRVLHFLERYGPEAGSLEAEVVLTPAAPDLLSRVRHLRELGFSKIASRMVRGSGDAELGSELKAAYRRWFAYLAGELDRGNYRTFDELRNDHSLRPLWKLLSGIKITRRCFWGLTHVVCDGEGNFYTCDGLLGNPARRCGSLDDGIDWDTFHEDLAVENREPCAGCWARYICGGTCYHAGIVADGDPRSVDSFECRLNELLAKECIGLLAPYVDRPDVLNALRQAMFH